MKTKLTESVRLLANGVSSDKDSSPTTRGVKITDREAVATDGFIIVIKQLPSPEMDMECQVDDGIGKVQSSLCLVPSPAILPVNDRKQVGDTCQNTLNGIPHLQQHGNKVTNGYLTMNLRGSWHSFFQESAP